MLDKDLVDLLVGDGWVMLGRDEDVVDSDWLNISTWQFLVLNNNLGFAIWSQPWDLTVLSLDGHLLADDVGKVVRVWVEGLGVPLVGGIST